MCLRVCPTYRISRLEADSPRGRISLIRALARNELGLSPIIASHLDGCLNCRQCELICPARVPYGELIDDAHATLRLRTLTPYYKQLLGTGIRAIVGARPMAWRLATRAVQGKFVPRNALRRLGFAPTGDSGSNNIRPTGTVYEPFTPIRADVALFLGCIARIADSRTLRDALFVLRMAGYRVHVPPQQRCCGALHWHQGYRQKARQLAQVNVAAFADLPIKHIVSTTTACTAMLHAYAKAWPDDKRAVALGDKTIDVTELLSRQYIGRLPAMQARVVVHEPCTTRFASTSGRSLEMLRQLLDDLVLEVLPKDLSCCGAAGAHQLLRPTDARAIRQDTLSAVARLNPDILVTSNVGCAMHLRSGLARTGSQCDVLHPVSLIAQQLRTMQANKVAPQ